MSDHVIFCSDIARRDGADEPISLLQGWCLASYPIRSLAVQTAGADYEPLVYGTRRPDVAGLYPQYPQAANCGFRSLTRIEVAGDQFAPLWLEIDRNGKNEDHVVMVDLEGRNIQTIELNEATRSAGEKIDDRNRSQSLALEGRLRQVLHARRGITLRLDLINKCNLRCIMCHFSDDAIFRRPTKQLTTGEFKALFDQIGDNISDVILSCGDEPLMSKFLPEILQYLAEEHPEVAIEFCTNAMLMKAPVRKTIVETRVARIVFSIDAVSKKLLESIRVGCRYEQVIGNILALRDLKTKYGTSRPAFHFNFVMMDRNIHEAPAFLQVARELGAESVDLRHVVPIKPYFDPADLLDRQPARYNYFREQIVREAKKLGLKYFLSPPFETAVRWTGSERANVDLDDFRRVVADLAGEHLPKVEPARDDFRTEPAARSAAEEFSSTFCPRPFSEIMLRDQEEVLPCPWHQKPLGYLRDGKSLREIFFGEDFARLRRNMFKIDGDPNCSCCPLKSGHLPTVPNN